MKDKLLETAVRTGTIIDATLLEDFFDKHGNDTRRVDRLLLETGVFDEEEVLALFGATLGIDFVKQIDPEAVPISFIDQVHAPYAHHHSLIAISENEHEMVVATGYPLELHSVDNLSKMVKKVIIPVFAPRAIITTAINTAYENRMSVLDDVVEEINEQSVESLVGEITSSEDLLDVVNRPPVIRLVNDILFKALQMRSSDVHIHPYENSVKIRYRIDGLLYDMHSLEGPVLPVIVSRIKVMSGMDIAERRLPQDGRCSVKIGPREVDLRVSTIPTAYGERTVLRLLDKSSGVYSLEKLGMAKNDLAKIDNLLARTHGVFFVTGPTGSGKTTSLYSFLQRIDSKEKNIITVEDPVEYQLQGISQIQVQPKKGMTFSRALKHVLRQDPDVIMVGEVRDEETARMVIQSSLTGHFVFSTLHTNDAPGAITRMLDLGIEPYLVASSVAGILAQRLVRRLCPKCTEKVESNSSIRAELGVQMSGFETVYRGRGCDHCFNTGYRGRTGIYELMVMDDNIRQCVCRQDSAGAIKKAALASDFTTLRMDGLRKVEIGETSLDELLRVVHSDEVDVN